MRLCVMVVCVLSERLRDEMLYGVCVRVEFGEDRLLMSCGRRL